MALPSKNIAEITDIMYLVYHEGEAVFNSYKYVTLKNELRQSTPKNRAKNHIDSKN